MTKISLLILTLFAAGNLALAQDSKSFYNTTYESRNSGSFGRSASILSFGLGFPHAIPLPYSPSGFPALYLKYEHGFLRDEIGLGGYVAAGFGSAHENVNNTHSDFSSFSVAILGYYHFNKLISLKKMDVYGGVGLAYKSVHYKESEYVDISTVKVPYKVGIRYFVKPKFSFYAESGQDGMTGINLGATFKLNSSD